MSKYVICKGCTTSSYNIDEKEFVDMTIDELMPHLEKLLRHADIGLVQMIFEDLVENNSYTKCKVYRRCECCGDTPEEYTLVIKD